MKLLFSTYTWCRLSNLLRTPYHRLIMNETRKSNAAVDDIKLAVVRNVPVNDCLSLSFVYSNPSLRMKERQFNFVRRRSEPLLSSVTRIAANIQREIENKMKRRQRKLAQKALKVACVEDGQDQVPRSVVFDGVLVETQISVAVFEGMVGDRQVIANVRVDQALIDGNRLRIGEIDYTIVVNPPTIKSLSLSSNLMAGFTVRPKVDVEFATFEDCTFKWYRSSKEDCNSWEAIVNDEQSYKYMVSDYDVGRLLKVVCTPPASNWNSVGNSMEIVSKSQVLAGPGRCPFEDRHAFTAFPLSDTSHFRCVSYNILADLYTDSDYSRQVLFPYCPPHALDADYRTQLLIKELIGYNSDVICLQEVDARLFENDLCPMLKYNDGGFMKGIFTLKGGNVREGLACFYRSTKLRLKSSQSVVLADEVRSNPRFADLLNALKKNDKLMTMFLRRTTVLQVVVLEFVDDPSRVLIVGNTHLYFRPDRDNIRLLQAGMCLKYIEQMVKLERSLQGNCPNVRVATVVCGDFNSSPPFGVYQLATTRNVSANHVDWSSNEEEIVEDLALTHSLQLTSACGCPKYTNFTVGFADCIDYIFIDSNQLMTSQVIPMPSDEQLREHTALPSVTMPSDHVALVADIKWTI